MPDPPDPGSARQKWIDRGVLTVQATLGGAFLWSWLRADPLIHPAWLPWMGGGFGLIAIAIGGAALLRLRHSFRPAPTPAAHGRLERGGIYRWLRHPMYVAVLGVVLAGCLTRPSLPVLVTGALHFLFYRAKSRYEEGLLRRRYRGYEDYRSDTWGLGP